MGRWAQRRIRGGGPPITTALIRIESANAAGDTIIAAYTGNITAADFDAGDFITSPTGNNPDTVNQSGPSALEIIFPGDISGETDLNYSGDATGVLTPQSIVIS